MSIRVRGTITIQRKTSSRGAFNIGDLVTEIGEFEVKDSLIEEFEPGKYTGDFLIKWIAPDSFSWRGRVFVKNRATLDEILIDDADESAPSPAAPPEPDPIEMAASAQAKSSNKEQSDTAQAAPVVVTVEAAAASPQSDTPSAASATSTTGDAALFGTEIFEFVQAREVVKLDATIDREKFRQQRDRLKELGYRFDAKPQTWVPPRAAEELCF